MSILDFFKNRTPDSSKNGISSSRDSISNTLNGKALNNAPVGDFELERAIFTSRNRLRRARRQFN
jgi:hypothetical protein